MNVKNQEYDDIKKQVLSHLRRKGYYTQPIVRAYPVTIQVLNDLVADGLIIDNTGRFGSNQRLYNSTPLLPSTIVVRNQLVQNLKVGNHCGHSGTLFAKLNERFNEVDCKDFVEVGVVALVEVKYTPKNVWERFLGRNSEKSVFLTLSDGSVTKVAYDSIYQVIRPEF